MNTLIDDRISNSKYNATPVRTRRIKNTFIKETTRLYKMRVITLQMIYSSAGTNQNKQRNSI